jgi:hypothetical protein
MRSLTGATEGLHGTVKHEQNNDKQTSPCKENTITQKTPSLYRACAVPGWGSKESPDKKALLKAVYHGTHEDHERRLG